MSETFDGAMTPDITLSSRLTFYMKVILPALWISIFGIVTVVLWFSINTSPVEMKWVFLAAFIGGSLSFWWWCIPLKKVGVRGGDLVISNFRKEIMVPLNFIESVTEN